MKRRLVLQSMVILFSMLGSLISPARLMSASKVYRTETVSEAISIPATMSKKYKVYTSDLTTQKLISAKKISLAAGTAVTVTGEKNTTDNKKWLKISFTYSKKTYSGYVKNTSVNMSLKSAQKATVIAVKKSLKVRKAKGTNSAYLMNGTKKVALAPGAGLDVIKQVNSGTSKWYQISFTYEKKTKKGYVAAKYVKLEKNKVTKKIYALTQKEFEKALDNEGFPESYRTYLRSLHEDYPFFEFKAYKTGLTWSNVIKAESKVGVNLIPNSKAKAWKSTAPGAYDSSTGKWKVFDGSSWVAASEAAVKYYMDPRNFLNENSIYQFENLSYQSKYQTSAGIKAILANTPFTGKFTYKDPDTKKSTTITYASAFKAAAKQSKVSPYHLASRAKQEVVTSATTTSTAVTGTNSSYPGIYNFYNIGATHGTNAATNGLKWASTGTTYLRPWTDRYRSIVGGGMYIGAGYINKGQDSVYLQKFNVTATDRYGHQYMSNVEAAYSEALKTGKAYKEMGLLKTTPIVFTIPVYENMPANRCPTPS